VKVQTIGSPKIVMGSIMETGSIRWMQDRLRLLLDDTTAS